MSKIIKSQKMIKEEIYTIADNGEYLVGEEAIKYEENEFLNQNKDE